MLIHPLPDSKIENLITLEGYPWYHHPFEYRFEDGGVPLCSAQRRAMQKALHKAGINVEVGTAECWQGKESEIMIVDFVRAANDTGDFGFLKSFWIPLRVRRNG